MPPPDQQPVPRGPLAVRWHDCRIGPVRAGALHTATVELENAGSAAWHSLPHSGIWLGYHWLDRRGNPLVWEGLRTQLPRPIAAGERMSVELAVRGPLPPGPYRLALDLVEEGRFWLAELGNAQLELDLEVAPRIERRLAVRMSAPHAGTERALAALAEPLVPEVDAEAIAYLAPGCLPAQDWSRRVLDAHAEGYAVVAGSIEPRGSPLGRRRLAAALRPWAPGSGRVPDFSHPYLCPSVVRDLEPSWLPEVEGLPAAERPADRLFGEPWLYDGRIALALRPP
ncbi:MAG: hypothetical protein H0T39_07200 [Actinobacteria bacterium]|nr:hypothetical protein [Actinomycetota bacterium]